MAAYNAMATRMKRGVESVVVEYDTPTGRKQTAALSDGAARRKYAQLSAAGKNPKVVKVVR